MRLYYINLITTHGRRVWSLALEGREDIERFKDLGWGLRTWDQWEWNDCDKRFGDDRPARHRSRPKEAASIPQDFRSGEAGGRDFQNKPAAEESGKGAILIDDYLSILNKTGWQHTHIIQAPMSLRAVGSTSRRLHNASAP
jgi:hypothetical protein